MDKRLMFGLDTDVFETEDGSVEVRTGRALLVVAAFAVAGVCAWLVSAQSPTSGIPDWLHLVAFLLGCLAPVLVARAGVQLAGPDRGVRCRIDRRDRLVRSNGDTVPFAAIEDVVICDVGRDGVSLCARTTQGLVAIVPHMPRTMKAQLEPLATRVQALLHEAPGDAYRESALGWVRKPAPSFDPEVGVAAFGFCVYAGLLFFFLPDLHFVGSHARDGELPVWPFPLVFAVVVLWRRSRGLVPAPTQPRTSPRTPRMRPPT